jgi:uncharacterized HhH-GPD family protein
MSKARYPFTPDPSANALLAADGTALLIGLCLEQQVRSEKAMSGPYHLRQRIGHLDARKIAAMPDAKIDKAFREKPALHRFPGMMAKRVKALCKQIADEYDGDGARVWARVRSADEVYRRLRELPGFGDGKAACGVRILAKFGGRTLDGWRRFASDGDLPWLYEDGKRLP